MGYRVKSTSISLHGDGSRTYLAAPVTVLVVIVHMITIKRMLSSRSYNSTSIWRIDRAWLWLCWYGSTKNVWSVSSSPEICRPTTCSLNFCWFEWIWYLPEGINTGLPWAPGDTWYFVPLSWYEKSYGYHRKSPDFLANQLIHSSSRYPLNRRSRSEIELLQCRAYN